MDERLPPSMPPSRARPTEEAKIDTSRDRNGPGVGKQKSRFNHALGPVLAGRDRMSPASSNAAFAPSSSTTPNVCVMELTSPSPFPFVAFGGRC